LLVVGAYPPDGIYDECTDSAELGRLTAAILNVSKPTKDPIYGEHGPLLQAWN
jgi:uncharacterized protein YjlB